MSLGLAVVRQSVDKLAAQLAAGQERMTREIAPEQDILRKISAPPPRPDAAPAHSPYR